MEEEQMRQSLLKLLNNVGNAHYVYETHVLGKRDDDWASWYADYMMLNGLNTILEAELSRAEVVNLLRDAADEQKKQKSKLGWTVFYQDYILKRMTEMT